MATIILKDGSHLTPAMDSAMLCLMSTPSRTLWIGSKLAHGLVGMDLAVELEKTETRTKVRMTRHGEQQAWLCRVHEWQSAEKMSDKAAREIGANERA